MNKTVISLLVLAAFLYVGCNLFRTGKKIEFEIVYANKGDTLSIYADSTLIAEKSIPLDYDGVLGRKTDKLVQLYSAKDSIQIRIVYNGQDSSFYFRPKDINGCYIGITIGKQLQIYYDKVVGGFGKYEPMR